MKTYSGRLRMGKKEIKQIELLLKHSEIDISYEGGGTFNKGDAYNTFDEKEAEKVKKAISDIKWILKEAIN